MRAVRAGALLLDSVKRLQGRKHSAVLFRCPRLEQPESLAQVLNNRPVSRVRYLAVQVCNAIYQRTNHLLTGRAGVVTEVSWIASALALDEGQQLRAMLPVGFDVQDFQPIYVTGI